MNDLKNIQSLNNSLFEWDSQFDKTLCAGWSFGDMGTKYFSEMIKSEFVYVAENKNKVVGYLAGSFNNKKSYSSEKYAELDNMYVLQEFRKHGIGKLLFEEFNKQCQQKGIKSIRVTASAKNSGAIAFYKKNGFEEFDITLRKSEE